MTTQYLDMSAN